MLIKNKSEVYTSIPAYLRDSCLRFFKGLHPQDHYSRYFDSSAYFCDLHSPFCMHTHAHTHTDTCIYTHAHAHTHTCTHAHMHTHTCIQTCIHTTEISPECINVCMFLNSCISIWLQKATWIAANFYVVWFHSNPLPLSVIFLLWHVSAPDIMGHCCVVFLRGGLRDKIIHGMARHTHLCSCRLWVAWPPKHGETEVCIQLVKAVVLVPVGFGWSLLLHFTDFVTFFIMLVLYIK